MGASDRVFSRKIPKEQVGDAANWELRSLGETAQVSRNANGLWSERERRAFERGRERGVLETTRTHQQAHAGHLERIGSVIAQLQTALDEMAARGADALLDLSLEVARQVLRRELAVQRDAVLPAVREAIALITDHAAHPRVHISPQDYELVCAELEGDGMHRGCRFVADPGVPPGGCRVETPQGEIDATVETRWRRVVAMLGVDDLSASDGAGIAGGEREPGA